MLEKCLYGFLVLTLLSCTNINRLGGDLSFSQSFEKHTRDDITAKQLVAKQLSNEINAYNLMALSRSLGGFIAMYEATDSLWFLMQAFDLAEEVTGNAINVSQVSGNHAQFDDRYLGFMNINPDRKNPRGGPHGKEVPLFESYFYRYLAKLIYISTYSIENVELQERSSLLLDFLKVHGWEKWYVRGESINDCLPFLFRSRTHMTSHWALVALFLKKLDSDRVKVNQYEDFLNLYNRQLRSNLRITETRAYIWNMTWDKPWPLGLNCNQASTRAIIQDGSHGNHVITYVVEAFELGEGWSKTDIARFVRTAKYILFDSDRNLFYKDLSQNNDLSYKAGLRFGDGFLKLARYDKELLKYFEQARISQREAYHFRFEEFQYVAEFRLAQKYLSGDLP